MNDHPIEQSADRTDKPVVTARRAPRAGGHECVDVRRRELTKFQAPCPSKWLSSRRSIGSALANCLPSERLCAKYLSM